MIGLGLCSKTMSGLVPKILFQHKVY